MDFIRVCFTNDGNIPRGFITKEGGKVPSGTTSFWFNPETQMVIEKREKDVLAYSYDHIPGDATFRMFFFPNHFESKTFEELTGAPTKPKQTRRKKDDKESRT